MPDTRATTKAKNEPAPQKMDSEHPQSSVAPNPTTNPTMDSIKNFFNQTLGQTSESEAPDQSSRTQEEPALEDRLADLESKLHSTRRYLSQIAHLADEKKEVPQLAAALRRIISEAPPQTQPLGKFSGQLVEDPAVFLQRLEVHLRNHQLQTPEDIDDAILPHLTGEAATWYGRNQASFLTLTEFQRRFRAEFTGYKRQKALRDATEVQQSPREPVTAFAQRLRRLCLRTSHRLRPTTETAVPASKPGLARSSPGGPHHFQDDGPLLPTHRPSKPAVHGRAVPGLRKMGEPVGTEKCHARSTDQRASQTPTRPAQGEECCAKPAQPEMLVLPGLPL
ncbi:hypothetical protein QE152_g33986 [Popillia japonica]|uniref:Retrotransposon gag domain-containing protein n=1 Tax=Popillia japonica TaxID=7064 RepID=A0AAW1IV70_POPJA